MRKLKFFVKFVVITDDTGRSRWAAAILTRASSHSGEWAGTAQDGGVHGRPLAPTQIL